MKTATDKSPATNDLVFVADVAAAFAAAATRPFEGAHAISLGGATEDVPDVIAAIMAEVPGARIDFDGPAVPMAPNIAPTDNRTLLGAMPFTPLREGISHTVSHYRSMAARS
jgi:nucleoside-diphosphate-sugar epimerase